MHFGKRSETLNSQNAINFKKDKVQALGDYGTKHFNKIIQNKLKPSSEFYEKDAKLINGNDEQSTRPLNHVPASEIYEEKEIILEKKINEQNFSKDSEQRKTKSYVHEVNNKVNKRKVQKRSLRADYEKYQAKNNNSFSTRSSSILSPSSNAVHKRQNRQYTNRKRNY
ncbi:hypothetical protein CEXT_471221 [Caerostris extrusa]|uniref:Uncharacterized protein n=1 Tax=Caerostris extrusa TaxID=172846 RepID=A0AAV4YG44_CAEEX|nr:hypothetical protein CEXT_471221 [Caerostris extrusa]